MRSLFPSCWIPRWVYRGELLGAKTEIWVSSLRFRCGRVREVPLAAAVLESRLETKARSATLYSRASDLHLPIDIGVLWTKISIPTLRDRGLLRSR